MRYGLLQYNVSRSTNDETKINNPVLVRWNSQVLIPCHTDHNALTNNHTEYHHVWNDYSREYKPEVKQCLIR